MLDIASKNWIAMNFFMLFQRSNFNLDKNKSICQELIFVHLAQSIGSTYCVNYFLYFFYFKFFFNFVSERYLQNFGKNWKHSKFLNLTGAFTNKKKKKFKSLHSVFRVRKWISLEYILLMLQLIIFEDTLLSSKVL